MADIKYLKASEIEAVLTEAKRQGPRAHLLCLLGFRHGLRSSELAALTLADVQNGEISVRRVKNSLHTIQPLEAHENVLFDEPRALRAWLKARGDADGSCFIFISRQGSAISSRQVYNIFNDVAFRAGIDADRRHPHCMKHSLGRLLAEKDVPLYHIQKVLGHRHITSTQIYLGISDREASAKASNVLNAVFA
jgi:site-specific recombinase XerD